MKTAFMIGLLAFCLATPSRAQRCAYSRYRMERAIRLANEEIAQRQARIRELSYPCTCPRCQEDPICITLKPDHTMALSKETIKTNIKAAFEAVMNDTESREASLDTLSDKIADAVVEAIRSSTIVYTSGLVAPTGGGPVTGTFQGNLQ